jgi:hypothetical protein
MTTIKYEVRAYQPVGAHHLPPRWQPMQIQCVRACVYYDGATQAGCAQNEHAYKEAIY